MERTPDNSTEYKPLGVTSTGVTLFESDTTKRLTAYAHRKTLRVVMAQKLSGARVYLIIDKNKPIFENQTLEGIAIRLDIMKKLES